MRAQACALFIAALASAPLVAQAAGEAAVTPYPADYFARSQPATAFDMVRLVPGFRLQEGNADLRGYSGAAGNVLLDGQRPASKQETLEDVLKRIPAKAVERIELVRSGAGGYDMQGYPLLANVIRRKGANIQGRLELEDAAFRHGYSAPRVAGELTYAKGDRVLDLAAALYRTIDDEHGFGSRNRYLADGTPLRLTEYAQPEGETTGEMSAVYRQPAWGGKVRLNGLIKDTRMFADIGNVIIFPEAETSTGKERRHTRASEYGLQFERPLGQRYAFDALAIRRDTRIDAMEASYDSDGGGDLTREGSQASETLARGVLRRQGNAWTLETGVEGAVNVLDSHAALEEDGMPVALPAANVRVEEQRAEAFVTATWRMRPSLTLEAGGRVEGSELTQAGDSTLSKSLSFFKPRLLLNWTPKAGDELRFLYEREVGQLDFADFVSSASVTGGSITAGNKDLEPDSLWRSEAAWEHRFTGGSLVVAVRHEAVSDVVDRIPVFTDGQVYDAVGNIGDGTRDELEASLNLPLDRWQMKGFTLQANLTLRRSRVTDPSTGLDRHISGDAPREGDISLTHDLPNRHLRWGVNYVLAEAAADFKVDEIEADTLGDRIDAFIEYKPSALWTVRLYGKNLTNSAALRTRTFYTGLRGTGDITYLERRVLKSGPYVGVRLQRSFGG